jgi:DNA transformation protein
MNLRRRTTPASERASKPKPLDSMQEWLEERLRAVPDLGVRRMFGGVGVYSGSNMFGILYAGRAYLKVDERTRLTFIEREMSPFHPKPGMTLHSYYEVPPDVLDDEDELLKWARQAIAAATVARKPRRGARSHSR